MTVPTPESETLSQPTRQHDNTSPLVVESFEGSSAWRQHLAGWLIITMMALLAFAVVPPIGEFPIIDDWDFVLTVRDWHAYREVRLSDWPAMTLLGQLAWGVLVTSILGHSYFSLRVATLILHLIASLLIHSLIVRFRQLNLADGTPAVGDVSGSSTDAVPGDDHVNLPRDDKSSAAGSNAGWFGIVGGLCYYFCPQMFHLAQTFMTDVPAISASVILLAGLTMVVSAQASWRTFLLVGLLASCCLLVRQTAIIPLIAFLIMVTPSIVSTTKLIPRLLLICIPFAVTFGVYQLWLDYHGRPFFASAPRFQFWQADFFTNRGNIIFREPGVPWRLLGQRVFMILLAVPYYTWPIGFALLDRRIRRSIFPSRWHVLISLLMSAGLWFGAWWCNSFSRLEFQLLFDFGLGYDVTSFGNQGLAGPKVDLGLATISLFQLLLRPMVFLGMFFWVSYLLGSCTGWRSRRQRLNSTVRKLRATLWLSMLMVAGMFFFLADDNERYLLPMVPFALLLLLSDADLLPRRSWSVLVGLALVMVCSVVGQQDFLVRRSVFWQAVADLQKANIANDQISAGIEFTGLYRFSPHYRDQGKRVRPFLAHLKPEERRAFINFYSPYISWTPTATHFVSYQVKEGTIAIKSYPFTSWLRRGEVYVLNHSKTPE